MRRQIPQHRGQRSPLLSRNSRFIEPIEEEEPEPEPIESSDDDEDESTTMNTLGLDSYFCRGIIPKNLIQGSLPQHGPNNTTTTAWRASWTLLSHRYYMGNVQSFMTSLLALGLELLRYQRLASAM
jgi:hypothetical protein